MEPRGKNTSIRYAIADSPLDRMLVARTDVGLCAVAFGDSDESLHQELRSRYPEALLREDAEGLRPHLASLLASLQPNAATTTFACDLAGTAFERRVWEALATIPPGTTTEYAQFAAMLGLPKAQRAVGAAVGKNPLAVLYPCHRLVAKGGDLHRYRWGLQRKRWLLALEGVPQELPLQAHLPLTTAS